MYRYYPLKFHKWALPAAKAAACVHAVGRGTDDAAFWRLHNYFFEHQGDLTEDNIEERSLAMVSTIPGIDVAAYQRCIAGRAASAAVRKDMRMGDSLQVHGTPTLFVNGQLVTDTEGVAKAVAEILGGVSVGKSGNGALALAGSEQR